MPAAVGNSHSHGHRSVHGAALGSPCCLISPLVSGCSPLQVAIRQLEFEDVWQLFGEGRVGVGSQCWAGVRLAYPAECG